MKKLIALVVGMFMLLGGVGFASDVDDDGKISWEIDLTCKTPGRTLLGYDVRGILSGSDTYIGFYDVAENVLIDTLTTIISPDESISVSFRVVEFADGDTLWGEWTGYSEPVGYKPPTTGCSVPRWLGF